MHYCEHDVNPNFQDIGDGLWWGATTITTVGYGSVVPISFAGRIVACFAFMFGIMAIGLPIHQVLASFADLYRARA